MKKILLILLLLCVNALFSQSLENLKNTDTIYIYFNHCKNQEKFSQINIDNEKTGDIYFFYFNKSKESFLKCSHIYFLKPEIRKEKKSFLKRNKIINMNFKKKHNLNEIINVFNGNKKIYLIDKSDIKKNMLILKEVRVQSSIFYEM